MLGPTRTVTSTKHKLPSANNNNKYILQTYTFEVIHKYAALFLAEGRAAILDVQWLTGGTDLKHVVVAALHDKVAFSDFVPWQLGLQP